LGDEINFKDGGAIYRVYTCVGGITGNKNPMLPDDLSKIISW